MYHEQINAFNMFARPQGNTQRILGFKNVLFLLTNTNVLIFILQLAHSSFVQILLKVLLIIHLTYAAVVHTEWLEVKTRSQLSVFGVCDKMNKIDHRMRLKLFFFS